MKVLQRYAAICRAYKYLYRCFGELESFQVNYYDEKFGTFRGLQQTNRVNKDAKGMTRDMTPTSPSLGDPGFTDEGMATESYRYKHFM